MAHKMTINAVKTYATEENADKAVAKKFGANNQLVYFIFRTADGRFAPVFLGSQALMAGVHFHFNLVHVD